MTYYLVSTFKSVRTSTWNFVYLLVPLGLLLYLAAGGRYPVKVLDSKCFIFSLSYQTNLSIFRVYVNLSLCRVTLCLLVYFQ